MHRQGFRREAYPHANALRAKRVRVCFTPDGFSQAHKGNRRHIARSDVLHCEMKTIVKEIEGGKSSE